MNEIVHKFLLAGDKFMPEMHLKQPGFTYSACGPFTKNKKRLERFMQTGNTDYIYKNDLDKGCFQHDMAYGKYRDLAKRTESDRALRDKSFKIASNPNDDDMKEDWLQWFTSFLIKSQNAVVSLRLQINLYQINSLQMNFINQLLENLKEEEFIHNLKTIFGV